MAGPLTLLYISCMTRSDASQWHDMSALYRISFEDR